MSTKQIVILMEGCEGVTSLAPETPLNLVSLWHPKGLPVTFIVESNDIYEIQIVEPRRHASWFINQKVSSNPSIYVASKVDPRFLVLPFLEKASAKFSPLDQVIPQPPDGCTRISLSILNKWNLDEIADMKDLGDDLILCRYNDDKVINWLRSKVQRTATTLYKQRKDKQKLENSTFAKSFDFSAQCSKPAATATSSSVATDATVEHEGEDIKVALQVISEYLTESMIAKLVQAHGLNLSDIAATKQQQGTKRKTDWETELEVEKETFAYMKAGSIAPTGPAAAATVSHVSGTLVNKSTSCSSGATPALKKPTVPSKPPATQKTMKPVQGVKSITSFFGKK